MLEYPDDDVRSVSVTATAAFLYAYQRSGQPEGIRAFNNLMTKFIPKLAENITDDWEHSVVVSSLESFTNLLKDCKQATTAIPGTPEKIMMCITKLAIEVKESEIKFDTVHVSFLVQMRALFSRFYY